MRDQKSRVKVVSGPVNVTVARALVLSELTELVPVVVIGEVVVPAPVVEPWRTVDAVSYTHLTLPTKA